MGIGAALVGGSVASGLVSAGASKSAANAQAKAADKAAEAQLQATRETNDLQRQQYNTSLGLFQPQWQSGVANQAALNYALGTGARPDTLTFNYPDGIGDGSGNAGYGNIQTINGGATNQLAYGSGAGIVGSFLPAAQSGAFPSGRFSAENSLYNLPGVRDKLAERAGSSSTYYKVGDKTFATMDEAKRYASGLNAGNAGNTFRPTYNGYAPMKEYFGDLKNLDNFRASPDYEFRRSEGVDSMREAAAAGGLRLAGNTLRGIGEFSSNLADNEYTDYYNRGAGEYYNWLSGLQGQAMTLPSTTGAISGAGQNYAANAGNALMAGGQARANAYTNAGAAKASGYEGVASAFNNTTGNIGQMFMMNQLTNGGLWG